MTERETLIRTFLIGAGWGDAARAPLAGDASPRRYERLQSATGMTAVLMDAAPELGQDVGPFLTIAAHLAGLGLSAPRVLAADAALGLLVLEDLGDALFARVTKARPDLEIRLYSSAIDVLIALFPHQPPKGLLDLDPIRMAEIARLAVDWYVPGITGKTCDRAGDFDGVMAECARDLVTGPQVLMLRDYHAENLIWLPDRNGPAAVGLLDFQDAMAAHPAYDLVSILQDARRDVPEALEAAMVARYCTATGQEATQFAAVYALMGAQRSLRILGIFARLSMHFAKPGYVDLIPRVWRHLNRNLAQPALAPLAALCQRLLPAPTSAGLQRIKDKCGTSPTP